MREQDEKRTQYIQEKGYQIDCRKLTNQSHFSSVRVFATKIFCVWNGLRRFLSVGNFSCAFNVILKIPKAQVASPLFFLKCKNTVVRNEDIGTLKREDAAEEKFVAQPRRKILSSFDLTNGTLISFFLPGNGIFFVNNSTNIPLP